MNNMKSLIGFFIFSLALGLSIISLPDAACAQTDKNQKVQKQEKEDDDKDKDEKLSRKDKKSVKISMKQAREIALKRIDGKIIEEELEKEKGRLQYAFDIRDANGKVWDVEIDAITGEVLQAIEDTEEDDNDDNKNDQGAIRKAGKSVYKAANSVRHATYKTLGKVF